MKYTVIFFYVVCCALQNTVIFANKDYDLFVHANQLFESKQYDQASMMYEQIEHKDFSVFYNLSLSYLHQGNLSYALLFAHRAEPYANFSQLTNLYILFDYIKQQIDPDYKEDWHDQFAIFLKKCILSISTLFVQIILFFSLCFLILIWYRRWYQTHARLAIYNLVVCIVFGYIWCYKVNIVDQKKAIVVKNATIVFAGPDASFYKKAELHAADDVLILNQQKGYSQIQSKGLIGWVSDNDIEQV